MLQLFSSIYGQDRQLLSDAYEAACDELQDSYRLNGSDLGTLVGPLVDALVSLYAAGQHDEKILAHYAVSRALEAPLMRSRARIMKQVRPNAASLQ